MEIVLESKDGTESISLYIYRCICCAGGCRWSAKSAQFIKAAQRRIDSMEETAIRCIFLHHAANAENLTVDQW
jgi:hypothetical protein